MACLTAADIEELVSLQHEVSTLRTDVDNLLRELRELRRELETEQQKRRVLSGRVDANANNDRWAY